MNTQNEQQQDGNETAKGIICNYLVGCAGIVFDQDENVLVGVRTDFDGNEVIALFGGKPEYDEALIEALAREIAEELKLDLPPSRYLHIGMRESRPGKLQRCITSFYATKITNAEKATIVNAEPTKCKELLWLSVAEVVERGLWQGSQNEVLRASNQLFYSRA